MRCHVLDHSCLGFFLLDPLADTVRVEGTTLYSKQHQNKHDGVVGGSGKDKKGRRRDDLRYRGSILHTEECGKEQFLQPVDLTLF